MNDYQDNEIQDVLAQLSVLEPQQDEARQTAPQALTRLQRQQAVAPVQPTFWQRLFAPQRRTAVVFASLLIVFLFSLSFPAVRAAASDFLGLFRVQKFAAISVSPEQIAILQQIAEEGLTPGELEMLAEPSEPLAFTSLAEAARATGLTPRTLTGAAEPNEIYVQGGINGRFIIDLAGSRAILEAAGSNPQLLPDSIDGQAVDIETFPGVAQAWAEDNLMLMQTESPHIRYPEGLDPVLIGQAVLQALGLNEMEAARLAQSIDWTGTLLLPIPQQVATYSEVTVDGVSGIAINSLSGEGNGLVWQKDGIVYLLGGDKTTDELLGVAATLR